MLRRILRILRLLAGVVLRRLRHGGLMRERLRPLLLLLLWGLRRLLLSCALRCVWVLLLLSHILLRLSLRHLLRVHWRALLLLLLRHTALLWEVLWRLRLSSRLRSLLRVRRRRLL